MLYIQHNLFFDLLIYISSELITTHQTASIYLQIGRFVGIYAIILVYLIGGTLVERKYSVYIVDETPKQKVIENEKDMKEIPDEKPTVYESPLMTTKELCKQLNMSWNTVQKHFFHLEEFPKKKIGAKWYFHRKQLELFLEKYYDNF